MTLDDETAERIAENVRINALPGRPTPADYVRVGYAARDAEVERLRSWKAQAIEVLNGWERVWEATGRPGRIGAQKSENVRRWVEELRAERDAAWAASNARLDAALAWEERAKAAEAVLAKVREHHRREEFEDSPRGVLLRSVSAHGGSVALRDSGDPGRVAYRCGNGFDRCE